MHFISTKQVKTASILPEPIEIRWFRFPQPFTGRVLLFKDPGSLAGGRRRLNRTNRDPVNGKVLWRAVNSLSSNSMNLLCADKSKRWVEILCCGFLLW